MSRIFLLAFLLSSTISPAGAQQRTPTREGAALRNLVLPGWGHQYAGVNRPAGRLFLYADVTLLAGYFGLTAQAAHLEGNLAPYAQQHAGTSIDGRSRAFVLAVTNYADLKSYNDEMLRRRQWNALLADTPENQWSWTSESHRDRFISMKDRYDRVEQNRPALLGFMVLNRVLAAASVYRALPAGSSLSIQTDPALNNRALVRFSLPF